MKPIYSLLTLLIAILFFNCSKTYQAKIQSNYADIVDSLVYYINAKEEFKILNIKNGLDTTITYSSKEFKTKDISTFISIFKNGKKVDSIFQFTDLGSLPSPIHITITDSLKLRVNYPDAY